MEPTYSEQIIIDNTFENPVTNDLLFCDDCDKETKHSHYSGQTVWDSYSYVTCLACGYSS